jgi:hypothetical protein
VKHLHHISFEEGTWQCCLYFLVMLRPFVSFSFLCFFMFLYVFVCLFISGVSVACDVTLSYSLGTALTSMALGKTGTEASQLLEQASEKFKEALKIKPDNYRALYNWGLTLSLQAEMWCAFSPLVLGFDFPCLLLFLLICCLNIFFFFCSHTRALCRRSDPLARAPPRPTGSGTKSHPSTARASFSIRTTGRRCGSGARRCASKRSWRVESQSMS